jgi:hypothetical protein
MTHQIRISEDSAVEALELLLQNKLKLIKSAPCAENDSVSLTLVKIITFPLLWVWSLYTFSLFYVFPCELSFKDNYSVSHLGLYIFGNPAYKESDKKEK